MAGGVDILFRAEIDATGAITGLQRLEAEAGRSGSAATRAASGFQAIAGSFAAIAGGSAVIAFLKSSVSAAIEAEQAEVKLAAVLKATGGVAGVTAEQIGAYAGRMQALTGVDDDVIKSGAAVLATFKNVRGEGFERTMTAALDMSAVFGQDLQSSITMLGKALEDPITGMTALRRVGVSFSESEKDVIKSLVEHNQLAEAQAQILKVVEAQVGGTAQALGQTLGGQLNVLKANFGDFKEALGGAYASSGEFRDGIVAANAALKTLTAIVPNVVNGLATIGKYASPTLTAFKELVKLTGEYVDSQRASTSQNDLTARSWENVAKKTRETVAATELELKATKAGTPERAKLLDQLLQQKQRLADAERNLKTKTAEEKKATDAVKGLGSATGKTSDELAKQKAETEKLRDRIADLRGEFDPLVRAQNDARDKMELVNQAFEQGVIDGGEYIALMGALERKYEQATTKAEEFFVKPQGPARVYTSIIASAKSETEDLWGLYDNPPRGWTDAWEQLGRDMQGAVSRGLTDGILGTIAGDDFQDAWAGVWQGLWQVSASRMDSIFTDLLSGADWKKSFENAGLLFSEDETTKVNWRGVAGMVGGVGMGYAQQKGNRWMGAASGALSGAAMTPGPYWWVGAIVGAVAGYIMAGAGSGGRKDYSVVMGYDGRPTVGMEDVSAPERQELARQFLDKYKSYRAGFGDVMQLLGGEADLRGFTFATRGSTRDLNSMWKQIVSGELPRAMLAYIQPQLTAGLQGLGIGDARIGTELQSLQEGSFDTAFTKFRAWVGSIVSLDEAMETMGGGLDALRAKVNETTRESFLGGFSDFMERARELTTSVDGLFSDEQVAHAQELLDLGAQQWQSTLQYLGQLESWIQGIEQGAEETRFGWAETRAREGGNENLASFWQTELERLQGVIGGAQTGETITEAWQKFQKIADQLWNLNLGDNDAANFAFRQWVEGFFDQTEQLATAGLRGFEEEAAQKAEEQRQQYEAMRDALAGATTNAGSMSQSLEDAGDGLDTLSETTLDANEQLGAFTERLSAASDTAQAFADLVSRLGGSILITLDLDPSLLAQQQTGQTDLVRIIRRGQTW